MSRALDVERRLTTRSPLAAALRHTSNCPCYNAGTDETTSNPSDVDQRIRAVCATLESVANSFPPESSEAIVWSGSPSMGFIAQMLVHTS